MNSLANKNCKNEGEIKALSEEKISCQEQNYS